MDKDLDSTWDIWIKCYESVIWTFPDFITKMKLGLNLEENRENTEKIIFLK